MSELAELCLVLTGKAECYSCQLSAVDGPVMGVSLFDIGLGY